MLYNFKRTWKTYGTRARFLKSYIIFNERFLAMLRVFLLSLKTKNSSILPTDSKAITFTDGPANNTVIYLCAHENLTLNWAYNLSNGESVHDVEWLYEGKPHCILLLLNAMLLA